MSKSNHSEAPKSRAVTTDHGKPFEQHLPALFGVKCVLDNNVKDMWMASNIDGIGSFDDLVLFIESTSGQKNLFLIQIKNKRNKELNSKKLTSPNKDFGLVNFEKSFLSIKDKFNSGCLPFSFEGEFQNITFLLFTNTKLNSDDRENGIIFNEQEEQESLLNTGKIFQIRNGPIDLYNDNFLKQFRIYCSQVDVQQIGNKIKIEIDKHFKQLDIAQTIMEYFADWSLNLFLNKRILTKLDIQGKLLEIVLNRYVILPNSNDVFQKAQIWNDITDEFNGIFLRDDKYLSKVYSAVQIKVYKHLENEDINIMDWNKLLDNSSDTINKLLEKLSHHLKHSIIKIKKPYTVKDLIMLLWHACQLPIVINLNADPYTQANVSNAILKFDYSECKRHYVFFGGKSFDLPHHTIFTSLELASTQNLHNALANIEVSLQNRESISLEKLSPNKESLTEITAEMFLDLLENPRVMKKNMDNCYIPRYLIKPLVSRDVLKQKDAVFVLFGNMKQFKQINQELGTYDCFQLWPYYKNAIQSDSRHELKGNPKLVSIIAMPELSKDYKDIIKTIRHVSQDENKTVHFFQLNAKDNLEWLYSNQNVYRIKPLCITKVDDDRLLPDENLFSYLNFNILSDRSGEGKTMLLNYLKDNCPPDMWMIYLNLNDIKKYIRDQEFSGLENLLFDKSSELNGEHSSFLKELFKHLLNTLKVVIAIDGLDDIKYDSNTETFLKCIRSLGTPTIIATRPSLQSLLEKNLSTMSLCFKPFTRDNQKMLIQFISQKNKHNVSEDDISQIIHKTSSLGNSFIAIPLQTKLFGRIIESRKDIDITNFDMSDLYDKYIEIQLSEVNSFNNSTVRTLSRLALLQFYEEHKISELFDVTEFYDDVEDKKEKFINSKIIQRIEKEYVIFAHKSLSEFLLAKYLFYLWDTSRHNILRPLLEYLFYEEQEIIRIFFDKIILKSSPLHKAVLENNEESFNNLIQEIKFDSEDKLGRNVLHIAAAYGKCNELRMARTLSSGVKILASYNEKFGNYISPPTEYERPNQISISFLRRLLKFNLDPHKKDTLFNMDVFDFAIQSSSLKVLEELFAENSLNDLQAADKDILLYHCTREGYWNIFKNIPSKNFKIKNKISGENLLHIALYSENFNIVNEIINNFSDIDERNFHGVTPLLSWLSSPKLILKATGLTMVTQSKSKLNENQMNILELFFNKKADVNSTGILGETPLHCVCLSENIPSIKKLLQHGAHINKKTVIGATPLHYAATCSIENVKLLVQNKSDINSTTSLGNTPLYFAAKHGQLDILKFLIKKGARFNKNTRKTSPLVAAIGMGHTKCVEVLIKNGADVNQIDGRSIHPLLEAVEKGHIDCIKLLISVTNLSDAVSFNALYAAATIANEGVYDYLLSKGINMNVEYENKTVLHLAALNVDKECMQLLLSKGFNINAKTRDGSTPLHVAAKRSLRNTLEYLISEGANINEEDNMGGTALTIAASYAHLDCLELLISSGSNIETYGSKAIYVAALKDHHNIIDFLLSRGVDINQQTIDGRSPIEQAIIEGELKCLKTLLTKGAAINLKGYSGKTPLFYAAEKDDPEIFKYLLSQGGDLNVKDNDGNTVLHTAVYSKSMESVRAILEKGVNIYEINSAGETPINIAERHRFRKIKRLLLQYEFHCK